MEIIEHLIPVTKTDTKVQQHQHKSRKYNLVLRRVCITENAMANGILLIGLVSFGEEKCFRTLSEVVEKGGRSNIIRKVILKFGSIICKTKVKLKQLP